jgi:L-asparagine transporter-like permease
LLYDTKTIKLTGIAPSQILRESDSWHPHWEVSHRYWANRLGFALGWNYLLKYLIVTPNNINAAGVVIRYWTSSVHMAAWMTVRFCTGLSLIYSF